MVQTIVVKVINWNKFQSDHGRNTYIWFRFHHAFFRHGQALKLGPDGTFLFLYFLCECADRKTDELAIYPPIALAQLGWKHEKLMKTVRTLVKAGCIEYKASELHLEYEASHTAVPDRIEENRIEENRIETLVQSAKADRTSVSFDFEQIYRKYPRKQGRHKGMLTCEARIKTASQYEQLSRAVDNYAQYCKDNGTETQYVRLFSTFMTSWTDWVDPESSEDFSKKTINWDYVFGRTNDRPAIHDTDAATDPDLRPECVPSGKGETDLGRSPVDE